MHIYLFVGWSNPLTLEYSLVLSYSPCIPEDFFSLRQSPLKTTTNLFYSFFSSVKKARQEEHSFNLLFSRLGVTSENSQNFVSHQQLPRRRGCFRSLKQRSRFQPVPDVFYWAVPLPLFVADIFCLFFFNCFGSFHLKFKKRLCSFVLASYLRSFYLTISMFLHLIFITNPWGKSSSF